MEDIVQGGDERSVVFLSPSDALMRLIHHETLSLYLGLEGSAGEIWELFFIPQASGLTLLLYWSFPGLMTLSMARSFINE